MNDPRCKVAFSTQVVGGKGRGGGGEGGEQKGGLRRVRIRCEKG